MNQRHSNNSNLHLYYGNTFQNLPILEHYNPFIEEYLEASHAVLTGALRCHNHISSFRVDLHYPDNEELPECAYSNKPITDFIESLKNQINWDRAIKAKHFDRIHHTAFHYIWCREIGKTGRPHYHLVILLNKHAYDRLGKFDSDQMNIAKRMFKAWSKATGMPIEKARFMVQFPELNPVQYAYINNMDSIGQVFQRMSVSAGEKLYH